MKIGKILDEAHMPYTGLSNAEIRNNQFIIRNRSFKES